MALLVPSFAVATASGQFLPNQAILQGLKLLSLLVSGQKAQYFTLLSSLPVQVLSSQPAIRWVIQVERCLGEGTYQRLREAQATLPAAEYNWMMEKLVDSTRQEIANGLEAAYREMSFAAVREALFLRKEQTLPLVEFAKTRGWIISSDGNTIKFVNHHRTVEEEEQERTAAQMDSPITDASLMIQRALAYAVELEQII
jgi:hypothetical protein